MEARSKRCMNNITPATYGDARGLRSPRLSLTPGAFYTGA